MIIGTGVLIVLVVGGTRLKRSLDGLGPMLRYVLCSRVNFGVLIWRWCTLTSWLVDPLIGKPTALRSFKINSQNDAMYSDGKLCYPEM